MDIVLIGGHGKVALLAEPLLAARGHKTIAVVRNPDHVTEVSDLGAEAVVLDVQQLGTHALVELFRGAQAVVWSAGAGGGDPERTYAVDRDAAIRTMDAAVEAKVGRYVMVSYFGASLDHGVPEDSGFFHYAEAKAAADEHLRNSELDWTILAPSGLTEEAGHGRISIGGTSETVSRADVAEVLVQTLERDDLGGRFIAFNAGSTRISDALDQVAQTAAGAS